MSSSAPRSTLHVPRCDRRSFLRAAGAVGLSGWLPALAAADAPGRKRACILLWMSGGPSQVDTFDPKPGHANNGPFMVARTAVPGLVVGEHLPGIAERIGHLAVVRSMSTKEGDHGRATLHLRTGNLPQGAIDFPVIGSLVAHERDDPVADLPRYVSVAPRGLGAAALSAGFLGPRHAPLVVGDDGGRDGELRVQNLGLPAGLGEDRAADRLALLRQVEEDFLTSRPGAATAGHRSAYDRAARLMRTEAAAAFDLSGEKDSLRDRYGRNRFGQGCLLARRLVERGVPFVEVNLGGWDTHQNNFDALPRLCGILDPAWSQLMTDLESRGLLDTTTIIWMGEFGRTPRINQGRGRDHFPNAWSAVLAGGGIKGGQAYGRTTDDGTKVDGPPTGVPDLLATLCRALGIDHTKTNNSNVGRPIKIVDKGKVIKDLIA
jgi:hypothetical protein